MNLTTFDNSALIVECYLIVISLHVLGCGLTIVFTCDSLLECFTHALDYDNMI